MKVKTKKQNAKDRDRTADREIATARVSPECPACEGTGFVVFRREPTERKPCLDCNGTGEANA